jgi:IclR family transcriptional regulator, KDG regulon repressor
MKQIDNEWDMDYTDSETLSRQLKRAHCSTMRPSVGRGGPLSLSVRAVDRALDILLCFTTNETALSMTQISERVEIHKSTVHRLLATLEAKRFLHRDKATGLYRLGFELVELASIVLRDMDLPRWASPYLQRLAAECGETVDLAALDGDHVIYLQVVESPLRLKIAAAVGQRLPAYCTATGKAFLAFLPDVQVDQIISAGLARQTDRTMVSAADLRRDLVATRERGFAISEQEFEPEINAVAAPILDASGYPIGVIAVVGPSFRLPRERMLALGRQILASTDAIAHEVGLAALSRLTPGPAAAAPAKNQRRGTP